RLAGLDHAGAGARDRGAAGNADRAAHRHAHFAQDALRRVAMIRRFFSLIVLVWLLGFIWFAVALPQPHEGGRSDAVVVLTGGGGRIERGLEALQRGWARRMLVSG